MPSRTTRTTETHGTRGPGNTAGENSGADRRRAPRIRMPAGTELRFAGLIDPAVVRDLSASGVCCETSRPLPLLSQVQVILLLPIEGKHPHEVACTGAVVRCAHAPAGNSGSAGYEIAIFFTEVDDSDRSALEAYVTSQSVAAQAG